MHLLSFMLKRNWKWIKLVFQFICTHQQKYIRNSSDDGVQHRRILFPQRENQSELRYSRHSDTEKGNSKAGGERGRSEVFGWYLHGYAKVHHGHTGVPVPAHVHHGVTTVRGGPLQRGVRRRYVILRLSLHRGVLRAFWESQEVVTARQWAGWWGEKGAKTQTVSDHSQIKHSLVYLGVTVGVLFTQYFQ